MSTIEQRAFTARDRASHPGPIVLAASGEVSAATIETVRHLAARDGRTVAVVSAVTVPPASDRIVGGPYVPDVEAYIGPRRRQIA